MTINYNVQGPKRKELVQLIANFTGCESKYKGAPSFAYEVDYFTIDKDGALSFDDRADSEVIERLLEMLYDNGFEAEGLPEADEPEITEEETTGLSIQIPMSEFTENSLKNVFALVEAKGNLIKKALDVDELPINIIDDRLDFSWFRADSTSEEIKAYEHFICKLCEMARNQKRVTAKEQTVENPRYTFRCFLIRLGFIGSEYKEMRKILLRNLEGNSAYSKSVNHNREEVSNHA